jgi:hypothetical protein
MASPWPALGLLSITCCSYSRCVPGRINSRPGRLREGAESSGAGTMPGTVRPLPLQAACLSVCATCCCFSGTRAGFSPGTHFLRPAPEVLDPFLGATVSLLRGHQLCIKTLLPDQGHPAPGSRNHLSFTLVQQILLGPIFDFGKRSWTIQSKQLIFWWGGRQEAKCRNTSKRASHSGTST